VGTRGGEKTARKLREGENSDVIAKRLTLQIYRRISYPKLGDRAEPV
jgi:hypothetical protein